VHDIELNDPTSPVYQHPLLHEARRLFGAFYGIATADDTTWFDSLVMPREAFTRAANFPRIAVGTPEGDALERACDEAERRFMRARDQVRGSPSFKKLHAADQKRIADIVFEAFPPWAGE
jgi:hypothetical protein